MNLTLESKILVTGGAGFIGSHLCESLVRDGSRNVYSLDNYSTGSEANHVNGVKYLKGDTQNISDIVDFSPDIIFHLGEYSRVEKSFFELDKVWSSNTTGTYNVLKFCINNNSKLVYAGSSTKFSSDGVGSHQSPYAWTKASNTDLVKSFGRWFSLEYAIVYFYNAYGGREIQSGDYATLIGIFTKQARLGENLSVVSPGTQLRNFTHVEDIVSALKKIGENGKGDGYGIGHDKSWSVLQVAQLFGGKIKMMAARSGNRMDSALIVDKTKSLGWEAKIDLADYVASLKI